MTVQLRSKVGLLHPGRPVRDDRLVPYDMTFDPPEIHDRHDAGVTDEQIFERLAHADYGELRGGRPRPPATRLTGGKDLE